MSQRQASARRLPGSQRRAEPQLGDIKFGKLAPCHSQAVLDLLDAALADSPEGYLAARDLTEIEAILAAGAGNASVGAWQQERLVAYSLCALEHRLRYPGSALLRQIHARGEPLWVGRGTVVARGVQGRLLMARLLRQRAALIAAMPGVHHTAGLIAVGNVPSLASALRAGGWLVGLEPDAYCLNYVCYGGALTRTLALGHPLMVPVDDIDAQTRCFATGAVVTAISGATANRLRDLRFQGWQAGDG